MISLRRSHKVPLAASICREPCWSSFSRSNRCASRLGRRWADSARWRAICPRTPAASPRAPRFASNCVMRSCCLRSPRRNASNLASTSSSRFLRRSSRRSKCLHLANVLAQHRENHIHLVVASLHQCGGRPRRRRHVRRLGPASLWCDRSAGRRCGNVPPVCAPGGGSANGAPAVASAKGRYDTTPPPWVDPKATVRPCARVLPWRATKSVVEAHTSADAGAPRAFTTPAARPRLPTGPCRR